MIRDVGIVIAIMILALKSLKKNRITRRTQTPPKSSEFLRLLTVFLMNVEVSKNSINSISFGRLSLILCSTSLTDFATATVLPPDCFCIIIPLACLPSIRKSSVSSLRPSSTSATSLTLITPLGVCLKTTSPTWSTEVNSSGVLIKKSISPLLI